MSCYSKEKVDKCNNFNDLCKSHSARSDREIYRICPSKLSKRELEDLYFALLENNLELKKTVNGQRDRLRGLSTKVQRMTAAQKTLQGKELKDCCVGTKAIVNEQKESLSVLRRANQHLAERLRMLNMRLCSAKQFYKKSPVPSTSRCIRCANNTTPPSLKQSSSPKTHSCSPIPHARSPKPHSCSSKASEPTIKMAVSCQNLDRNVMCMTSAQTETRELERQNADMLCDENKCRTAMEELKQKIVILQAELCEAHCEYSSRISRLENEVQAVRKDNVRVRSERTHSEQELQRGTKRASELLTNLRTAEARCAELTMQLSIEKRKVAELETRLKAANISDRVNNTINDHLITKNESKTGGDPNVGRSCNCVRMKEFAEAPTKDVKDGCTCSPPPDTELQRQPKKLNKESKTSENSKTGADPKVICGCPRIKEFAESTPTKDKKCICACPVAPDIESIEPTKDPTSISARPPQLDADSKELDKKCICACPQKEDVTSKEPFVCKPCQGLQNIADTGLSPRAGQDDGKISKMSDDSGYVEANRSQDANEEVALHKLNKELMKKILELQTQVDSIKNSEAKETADNKLGKSDKTAETGCSVAILKSSEENSNSAKSGQRNKQNSPTQDRRSNKLGLRLDAPDRDTNKPAPIPVDDLGSIKSTYPRSEELNKSELISGAPYSMTNEDLESNKIEPFLGQENKTTEERRSSKFESGYGNQMRATNECFIATDLGAGTSKMVTQDRILNEPVVENLILPVNYDREPLKITEERRCSKIELEYENQKLLANDNQVPDNSDIFTENPNIKQPLGRGISKTELVFGTPKENRSTIEILPGKLRSPIGESFAPNDVVPTFTAKESCEQCAACTFDKECEAPALLNKKQSKDNYGAKTAQSAKDDQHNSLQIPGPIPVDEHNTKDWKRNVFRHFSSDKGKKDSKKNKDKHSKQKKETVKEIENGQKLKETSTTAEAKPAVDDAKFSNYDDSQMKEERYSDVQESRETHRSKDSIEIFRNKLQPNFNQTLKENQSKPESMNNYYTHSDHMFPIDMVYTSEQGTQMDSKTVQRQQESKSFGIQLVLDDKTLRQQQQRSSASSPSEPGTYTVSSSKQTRSTSTDNTECEISSMTDLPSESDGKSCRVSPGEDKMTTTYTDSYTSPVNNYSLSEGELPTNSIPRRISYDVEKPAITTTPNAETAPSQKMEAALQAITDELARCKQLIQSQRPDEKIPSSPSQMSCNRTIALRPGVATQSIGDAYAPKCIFTLHIGTVVLSDEAVLNSKNKALVLTWKFYDQNIAMTRMHAGRVVLFDFSTEYDIKITDDFLNYMKHEEMPIVVCELDKQDEPFATCTLPLRDALLHTNRRADLSLALVAGPQMLRARAVNNEAADALDAGDEVGVIDIWCMLRADVKLLPTINRAIAKSLPPTPKSQRNSRVMQQVTDDEPSNEFTDLDLTLTKGNTTRAVSVGERTGNNDYRDVAYTRTSRRWGSSMLKLPCTIAIDSNMPPVSKRAEQQYDPNNYPPLRRSSNPRPPPPTTTTSKDEPEAQVSALIVNEVETKIKSSGDMRHALEKTTTQNNFTRPMPKSDEDIASQAHSSIGSLRSILARLQRRESPKHSYPKNTPRSSNCSYSKRASKNTLELSPNVSTKEHTEAEIYRRYDNIRASKNEASKKSVTIVPKCENEEPQRDRVQDIKQPPEEDEPNQPNQSLDITVLWLALNEECEAMVNSRVQRVYVAYSFLGRHGAELETPVSLPKPKHYVDKCYFNFKKTFELADSDLPLLGHMARCRAASKLSEDKDCIVFSVVSEPPEDPLGLETCEDIGYAYLYLGDLLAYSAGSPGYTEVIPVRAARGAAAVCGVLAVRLDGLDIVRRCLALSNSQRDQTDWSL